MEMRGLLFLVTCQLVLLAVVIRQQKPCMTSIKSGLRKPNLQKPPNQRLFSCLSRFTEAA